MRLEKKELFAWMIVVLTVIFTMIACGYSFFQADDFSHYNEVREMSDSTLLIRSFQYLEYWYKTWAGIYFAIFVNAVMSPLEYGGVTGLRIFLEINCLLFFITLYLMIDAINRYLAIEVKSIYIYAVITVLLMNLGVYGEIFYWFSGACSYSMPLSFGMLGIYLMLEGKMAQKSYFFIIASFLVFLAAGGTLEIAGIISYILLFFVGIDWYLNRKINKCFFSVFGSAFLGSIINVLAPGNYKRHSGEVNLFKGGVDAIRISIQEFGGVFLNALFVVTFIACIFIGFKIKKKIALRQILLLGVILWLGTVVTIYPVALGYNLKNIADFPERTVFAINIVTIISGVYMGILFGILCSKYVTVSNNLRFCMLVMCVLFLLAKDFNFREYGSAITLKGILNGEIKAYSEAVEAIYNEIENSTDENVIIPQAPESINGFPDVWFSSDSDNWINESLAKYYGKESVRAAE